MAKRLTDSTKWEDAWFADLPSKYKLFWIYLLDKCDHAGIWKVNFKHCSFFIGEHLEPSEVRRVMSERIEFISDEYWYVKKFCEFQYGTELPKNKVGDSIANLHQKHNIQRVTKGLGKGTATVLDKDKELDKDINEEYFKNSEQAWKEWQGDEMLIEELMRLVSMWGFKAVTDVHIGKAIQRFLTIEFDKEKDKKDLKSHLKRWVNRNAKDVHTY